MKLPDITIKIIPSITVPYVAIKAQWQSPDGTERHIQTTVPIEILDAHIGTLAAELLQEIKTVEEELNG